MKRTHLFVTLMVLGLALSLVPANTPAQAQRSQDTYYAYFPVLEYKQVPRVEWFEEDPEWASALLKDPRDGYFEHSAERESYWGIITDNSGLMVSWPNWTVRGDYKLEVDARHVSPNRKSFNGLGIAFNATDDFSHFYALMIAAGGAQHAWAVVRFDDTRATYETNSGYRGGPHYMENWDDWNHIEIRVVDGIIDALCNDHWLPGGAAEGTYLADDRLVGLVVTSYEFSNGEIEFDNLKLTPLYPGDPDYEETIARRETRAALAPIEAYEFDTPALDLH